MHMTAQVVAAWTAKPGGGTRGTLLHVRAKCAGKIIEDLPLVGTFLIENNKEDVNGSGDYKVVVTKNTAFTVPYSPPAAFY